MRTIDTEEDIGFTLRCGLLEQNRVWPGTLIQLYKLEKIVVWKLDIRRTNVKIGCGPELRTLACLAHTGLHVEFTETFLIRQQLGGRANRDSPTVTL
jgi:hypothetical protein